MNLYLLENHSTSIRFRRGSTSNVIGVANFFLRDNEMSPTGKGKLRDGRFPWLVYQSPESLQVFGFKLYVSSYNKIIREGRSCNPSYLVTEVGGDIDEIFKYVFSTSVSSSRSSASSSTVHSGLILKVRFIYSMVKMTAVHGRNGGFKFLASCKINKSAANGVYDKKLNESILKRQATSDFVLVAENGVAMTCHRNFLEAHCPSFEIAFGNQSTPIQHRLNLSEEGLKALLDFVYCLKLDIPREKPSVALELLDIASKSKCQCSRRP
ncbi:hypothetical protein Ocin01_19682 [Orchesella cincta]|uniref:BTB domain-containing protein n=1 Tax=Orchesella cincta TaxID=48709 RepID=A0A1D2M208_ORCCI|nr:hypothetical protein Ocin01_19682 [Orchesella cincta]